MTGADDRDDDLDVLAGEYVLGLLDAEERQRFEARLPTEPALANALRRARDRFLEFDTSARPVAPSADLWPRIESSLRSGSNVIDIEVRRDARAARRALPQRLPRSRASFWQGFAVASLVALIAAGATWSTLWPDPPRLVVVLLDAQAQPVSIVEAFAGQKVRVVPLDRIEVPTGRTLQVWTLPDPATGPVSIGLLRTVTATTFEGPPLPPPKQGQLYEITLEPSGGSPTGRPTGPIVGKGFAKEPRI